jgi:hypothetical protein
LILSSIPPGRHVLRVARAGEQDDERVIEINPDPSEQIIQALLKPSTAGASRGSQAGSSGINGPASVLPGIVMCAQCGGRFAAGVKFCGRCGGTIFLPVSGGAAEGGAERAAPVNPSGAVHAAPSGEVVCQRCGVKSSAGTKFCGRCGATISSGPLSGGPVGAGGPSRNIAATPFVSPTPQPSPPTSVRPQGAFCIPCGTSYPPGTRFCGRCGNTI